MTDPEHIFRRFDVNRDGTMSTAELESALLQMGVKVSSRLLTEVMLVYDKDKNGVLELAEFKSLVADMKCIQAAGLEATLKEFRNFDKDGSGFIEPKELKKVLEKMGMANDNITVSAFITAADTNDDGKDNMADAVFKEFDRNGDGTMSVDELQPALEKMGVTNVHQGLLNACIEIYDSNKNKTLELDEFKNLHAELDKIQKTKVADTVETFKAFDKDGSGFIDKSELKGVMKALGMENSDKTVDALIKAADTNGDGKVSLAEFAKIIGHGK